MKLKKLIVSGIALTVAIAFVDAGTLKGNVKYDGNSSNGNSVTKTYVCERY